MNTLVKTYDPRNGRDLLERQEVAPRSSTHGIMPARVALQAVKARVRETNRRQNFVRWSVTDSSIAGTWNPLTLYRFIFDTEHHSQAQYKGRKVNFVANSEWKFICGEPGIYNIKGHVSKSVSFPAINATKIQLVTLYLRHKSFADGTITYYEQSRNYASVGLAAGMTVAHYLRGWSLPIRDKIPLEAGDELEVYWEFQGAGAISFLDEYIGFIAIQKTGEKYIDGGCYCG